jgi:hypothetical protein
LPHQVPFPPAKAIFVGIDVLLAVRPSAIIFGWAPLTLVYQAANGVSASYDALEDLFECIQNFLKRLRVYSEISPTPVMTDILIKIIVEVLSVLALATKQIKLGRFSKHTLPYLHVAGG